MRRVDHNVYPQPSLLRLRPLFCSVCLIVENNGQESELYNCLVGMDCRACSTGVWTSRNMLKFLFIMPASHDPLEYYG